MEKLAKLTSTYSVAPQLDPSEFAALAEAGYKTVICNRPDAENPPELQAAAMQVAAEAAGLDFVFNPIVGGAMHMGNLEEQEEAIAGSEGPVVAYCASGTRSAVVWAFTQAGKMATPDIISTAEDAGFYIGGMAPQIDALAANSEA